MVFDDIDISMLPANSQEAFSQFERKVREAHERVSRDDRDHNVDQNDNYLGSYEPERAYVTAILAFLDEYDLETDVEDISALDDEDFYKHFKKFKAKVQYITTRYDLRKNRIASGGIGTVIEIVQSYKAEIGGYLERIRKIVNQEVKESPKKDKIFTKIAALQSEVDCDQTTVDAAFGRMLDLGKVIGEAGGNLKPAIDQLERVKNYSGTNLKRLNSYRSLSVPKSFLSRRNQREDMGRLTMKFHSNGRALGFLS